MGPGWQDAVMPCLVALLALFVPRLTIVLVVIFSDYIGNAYSGWLWPLLGFFFAPLTVLAYAFAINSHGSVDGWYLVLVIVAALMDVSSLTGGGSAARGRRSG